ncbi:hypothetical protein [Limnospira platensis]|uniref:hypothetical protein n=1 Tax=Limnospira platensis TaxID=118562 RepID=UPI000B27EC17|nr:hypothetical protein APLC1_2954 [Arthrospira platensis C1]
MTSETPSLGGSDLPRKESVVSTLGDDSSNRWYLGLEVGTTGISAALLDRLTEAVYPIYWLSDSQESDRIFRLPSRVYLHRKSGCEIGETEVLQGFKPYLSWAIPHHFGEDYAPCPLLQVSPTQKLFLGTFKQALQLLLSTISPQGGGDNIDSEDGDLTLPKNYQSGANGLTDQEFKTAYMSLSGVVVGCPTQASHAYGFNVRETILAAGLVKSPSQIWMVEDAIATWLSEWEPKIDEPTLIIDAGAATTELMVMGISQEHDLTYADCFGVSVTYGGYDVNLDIICQFCAENMIDWDGSYLVLPTPGTSQRTHRDRLQQKLVLSALIDAIESQKPSLQAGKNVTISLQENQVKVTANELDRRVLVPFVKNLNREFNHLISKVGVSTVGIKRAICRGGNGSWSVLSQWLRQKLPNASIISITDPESWCNYAIAQGLARLPLFPELLNYSSQQYGDYFLLGELLRVFGDLPLSIPEVMTRLEERGVNTRCCKSQILAILKGQLPVGFIPSELDTPLIVPISKHPQIDIINQGAIFYQDVDSSYFVNLERSEMCLQYLQQLSREYHQVLTEPLAIVQW